jgi:hypothetical protein
MHALVHFVADNIMGISMLTRFIGGNSGKLAKLVLVLSQSLFPVTLKGSTRMGIEAKESFQEPSFVHESTKRSGHAFSSSNGLPPIQLNIGNSICRSWVLKKVISAFEGSS